MNKKLLSLLQPYRVSIIFAILIGLASALMNVVLPKFIGAISDEIQKGMDTGIDLSAVERYAGISLSLMVVSFALGYGQQYLMVGVSQDMSKQLRSRLNAKLDRIPISYFDSHPNGDTLSRITNDVDQINTVLMNNITNIMTAMATVAGCLVMMFVTNWVLAICVIASSFAGFEVTSFLTKTGRPFFRQQQMGLGALNGQIEEVFSGHIVVKAFNCEDDVRETFHEQNEKMYESSWKSQFISGMMSPVMAFIGNLGYVIVCIVGAVLMLHGMARLSTIVSFILYVRMFQGPMMKVAQSNGSMQPAFAAADRIFALLDETELDESGVTQSLPSVRGDVSFSHVKFGYLPGQTIVHDFTQEVKQGQKIAIVGPTGAGKTTMVNLLMRFYELDGGEIRLDGVPISALSRENLHQLIGMVLQETWTFEGSIRDNIVFSTEGVTEKRLEEIIRETGLEYFVRTLPQGVDTVLSEQTEVSAGQKQLLTIARAMAANPPVLILDEATSSVDTRLEKIIGQAIDKLTEGRTSFVIAHRLSTIQDADVIFVMKDGDVIETGTHDSLLKKGGLYAELYNSQFEEKSV